MNKTIRLCMFDMGGVLALHSDSSLESFLLRDFGVEGHDSFASLDPRLPALLAEHSKAAIDEESMWEQFTALTGIVVPQSQTSLWGKYFKPELDEHVYAIIEELKAAGHRVVCATNTEEAHYAHHRDAGQYDIFDAVYASLHLGEAKPDASFFEAILAKEGIAPEEAIFIDDLGENCESAHALGIHAFHFKDAVELKWYLVNMEML